MKKIVVLFLSVIMVFSLAACGAATPAAPESAAPESPVPAAEETAPAPEETAPAQEETDPEPEETVPAPEETPTVEQAYAVVIGEYYTALEQRWNGAELMEDGLNYMAADCYGEEPLENLGYAIVDLDGDGVQELLIGPINADEFFDKMIFSLYTLDENGVNKLVFDGTERNRYYYAGENRFANQGSSAYNDSFDTTVKLEDGEMIDMTYTTAPADYVQLELTPFSQWVK